MRRILMTALVGAAIAAAPAAPAQASLTLVGTFSGNQCTGGPITTCYAAGFTAMSGTLTQVGPNGTPVPGSPGILGLDGTGSTTGFSDWITVDSGTGDHILNFDYTGSEVAHFIGVFQGGSGLNCDACNNTYQLFYDANGITSGTIDLNTYFTNNGGISHVDLFDSGAVPEPATWALMLLGFAGVGAAMRRSRKSKPALMQIA
jgi:hypothetical protein